ncbi:methyltransferase domain-containing protein [Plectonema cf. radiosum LEGE 06105]|uniref:Methyltransferase domain-containing protein n=1 Tax=Plectonema cf. radiosum LEGE 06105 TaxID=945769 RepID=A0A8J7JWF3_9CYAN|nr:methyltransferase domain-containing protein [Plectonema radiosum]MBE9216794.1 methyltransferase domain-containing protein [Plectonema cf. radiosum LEGE 06105]
MLNFNDESVLDSWNQNADSWITTIENEEIASRKIVTNHAIIDAIISYSPESILDLGCGEGWLTRELTIKGIEAWGVDGVSALIKKAQLMNCGKFLVASYEDIVNNNKIDIKFDAAVCNFSLLGKETVDNLIPSIPSLLKNNQLLFIQTLHPVIGCGELPYIDGWRQELWNGFNSDFKQPAPWYFRKIETWIKLLKSCGFSILECREPINPITQKPASIILIACCC